MLFSIGVVVGVVIAWMLLRFAPRRVSDWLAFVMGLAAAVVFAAGWRLDFELPRLVTPLAIALPFAALLFNVGGLLRGERAWTNWAGLVLSLAPGLFWILFAIGEIAGPPH